MSFERKIEEELQNGTEGLEGKLDVSLLKFLWQSSPFGLRSKDNYPQFFKRVTLLNSFTDNEIRIFCNFLHRRDFSPGETIFRQDDTGYGFYFVFDGQIQIYANYGRPDTLGDAIVKLGQYQYFGEMGLLQEFNRRNATVVAVEKTTLLALFKPDLHKILATYPILGAKFLHEVTLIMASRMGQLTKEIIMLKKKVRQLEEELSQS